MSTLYIRGVDEDVARELRSRAAAAGMSLSAYVAAQLAELTSRPTNRQIVARLRSRDRTNGPSTEQILSAVKEARR
ncbi:FitA-like ribbon-helix-helix domain-containing protein [Actinomyces sp. MRS3W]|uniref:FitA-like ribbon-helix-helix domain-containing protein n=1 Tax=Actinomyces sp. MRS3W TaxID=2800796 RepID=UPI0028FD8C9B|nr:antitoxin [Actinomyces sp. MRS3W]MDU0347559.1 antitoxin [Actinomyces sp. MRS3W]